MSWDDVIGVLGLPGVFLLGLGIKALLDNSRYDMKFPSRRKGFKHKR